MTAVTSTVAPAATVATEAAKPAARNLPLTSRAKAGTSKAAKPATPAVKKAAAKPVTPEGRFTNHSKNAFRAPDLGGFKAGDKVTCSKPGTWTVVGPAQGNTTLKIEQVQADGTKISVFRFARNLTPVKK